METHLLIKGGRVIDPKNNRDGIHDIYIVDKKIAAFDNAPSNFKTNTTIDAKGLIVSPGFIDLSTHIREPGQKHKGTIESESKAAAAGGFTHICCPPDTSPVIDSSAVATLIQEKAEDLAYCHVLPQAAMTKNLAGEQLSEMYTLQQVGCVAVSNARQPIANSQVLRRCLEYAATYNITVFFTPLDHALANDGCVHEGLYSTALGLPGIPATAETIAVARDLLLAEQTGVTAHFCQLSCLQSVEMIANAQQRGLPVTADVAIHQLHLTEEVVEGYNSLYHVQPPLRTTADKEKLIKGLQNNVISAICSNHQPHDTAAKMAPFAATEAGITGLETLLPLALDFVRKNIISLNDLIARLTTGPANILNIDAGHLSIGAEANLCIFDDQQEWQLTEQNTLSGGLNSPFMNQSLVGKVQHTIFAGSISYQD